MRPSEMCGIHCSRPARDHARLLSSGIRRREREGATRNRMLRERINGKWLERLLLSVSNNEEESV